MAGTAGIGFSRVSACLCLPCMPICLSGKTPQISSIPHCKNILLYRNSELRHSPAIPVPGEGRSYVVTNVDRGAVDAAASGTRKRDQGEMNLVRSASRADGR